MLLRPIGRRWPGNWTTDSPQSFTDHVCSQQIAFLRRKFFGVLLLEVGGLGHDEKLIDQSALDAGEEIDIDA